MEQDEYVYEYRLGEEVFRFEAHGPKEAQDYRPYVELHFRDRLGPAYAADQMVGPIRIRTPQDARRIAREGLHLQPQAWGS